MELVIAYSVVPGEMVRVVASHILVDAPLLGH